MLRVPLSKSYIKRTFRPLYGFAQSTPKSCLLDPAWDRSVNIFPGMCMMHTAGDNYTLLNTVGVPAGFSGEYVGGDGIDEPNVRGLNVFSVWVMGPDAEAEILAPAFDTSVTWTDPGDGTDLLIHAWAAGTSRGKLAPAGAVSGGQTLSALPIARLIKVASTTKIIIGGLMARASS